MLAMRRPKFRAESSNDLRLLRLLAEAPDLYKRKLDIQYADKGRDPFLVESLKELDLTAPVRVSDFHAGAFRELAGLLLSDAEAGTLTVATLLSGLQQLEAQLDDENTASSEDKERQRTEEFQDDLNQIRESLLQNMSSPAQDVTPQLREKSYDQLFRAVRSEQLSWERDKKLALFNYYNERHDADKAEQAKREASVYTQAAALVRHSR
ncbi:MAG: hypothetical protein GX763_08765 [Clostridiaceae bacterium]|nr:hypothetical protein [Clostridiaceae bacterium]